MRCTRALLLSSAAARVPLSPSVPVVSLVARHSGNLSFSCGNGDGETMMTLSAGKGNEHASPMQALLFALASCALTDVVIILNKQRVAYSDLRCDIRAQRAVEENGPRPFRNIHLDFSVKAPGLALENFARTVDLSVERYCGVHATLTGGPAAMSHTASLQ